MKKYIYLLLFLFAFGTYSCETEYDLEVDMSDTVPAYITIDNSDSVTVSETKTFTLNLRTFIPVWEDIMIDWTIAGEGITAFSGTHTFPKMDGSEKSSYSEFEIDVPGGLVPEGSLSAAAALTYTCSTASGKEVRAGHNGDGGELGVTINKYIALDRSNFVGLYTEDDGTGPYPSTVVSEDPDDEFGLIIGTQVWGAGASYKVQFNTITSEVSFSAQSIGADYDVGLPVWYEPAQPLGTFDPATGNFTVNVEQTLPDYPHSFGASIITYVKE